VTATSRSAFAIRDFRLLWIGEAVSALGDQFVLVALPWLALILTGSPLALGSVLALMAVPRALLMLVGGVYVDRLSPRRVMLGSNAVRLVAVAVLGLVVLGGAAQLWMLYAFALVFGIADAFFFPAQNSIVPLLVDDQQLQQANGIVQGTAQLSVFLGPAIAGLLIAGLGTTGSHPDLKGVAAALFVDAGSFLVSLLTLLLIRRGSTGGAADVRMTQAIREGISFVWGSSTMRFAVLLVMAINLLIVGPFEIGVPMIAYRRLPEGAAAFGVLMSGLGGGALAGMLAAAVLPNPRPGLFGSLVMAVLACAGLGLAALAVVDAMAAAVGVTAVIGFATGYGNLLLITWAQQRIPDALMGRVISLIGLGSMAFIPLSQLLAGAAVQLSLAGMLLVSGGAMFVVTLASIGTATVRGMGLEPTLAAQPAEGPATNISIPNHGDPGARQSTDAEVRAG
jgi:MFS family permease